MKYVAFICQDASRFFHDACYALTAHSFIYRSDVMQMEITVGDTCYTYLDAIRYSSFPYAHVLRAGYPTDQTIKAHETLIQDHVNSVNSIDDHKILTRPETGLLGNIKVFNGYNIYDWLASGEQNNLYGYTTTDMTKKKCECGVSITMGKDDSPEYHSSWCPIYKPSEKK